MSMSVYVYVYVYICMRMCMCIWICKPCGQSFLADMFDALNLDNHQKQIRKDFLVCKRCRVDGYNPRDTTDYPCECCGAKGCGLFEKVELEEYKKACAGKKPKMVCKTCSIAYERLKTAWTTISKKRTRTRRIRRCSTHIVIFVEQCRFPFYALYVF